MLPVAARTLLGLSVLALGAGTTVAKSPPVDRLGVVDTLIHQIQGDGLASPRAGLQVTTRGVVTAVVADGYFLQSLPGDADGDPATSEGLFIHTGSAAPGVAVGQEREVSGRVEEALVGNSPHQLTLTRLADTESLLLASGVPLPAPVAITADELSPDADLDALERLEGMRVSVARLTVVGAAGASIDPVTRAADSDGIVHAVWGHTLGVDYQLPMREPGLSMLDASTPPAGKAIPMHDTNPEVLRVDSRAQPGAPRLDLGLNDRLSDAVGVLGYADARYSLLIDPVSPLAVVPRPRGAVAPARHPGELRMAWVDLGELFDASDDPALAEPVPSPAAYQAQLAKIAGSLCLYMDNPEVLAVSGAENLQVLRDLSTAIDANPSTRCPSLPNYEALMIESQANDGLDIGFLVSKAPAFGASPRITASQLITFGAGETSANPDGSTVPLFETLPLMVRLGVISERGRFFGFTAVNVRLHELEGADSLAPGSQGWATEGERIMTLRARQAAYLFAWVQTLHGEPAAVFGGFEADAFNDGRVDVMGVVTGRPAPANESWVPPPGWNVLGPLTNLTLMQLPAGRYNITERGDFRALDHILVNEKMLEVAGMLAASPRMNADFPASRRVATGAGVDTFSARDPRLARVSVKSFLDADVRVTLDMPDTLNPNQASSHRILVVNEGPDFAPAVSLSVYSNLQPSAWSVAAQWPGWNCGEPTTDGNGSSLTCRHDGLRAVEYNDFMLTINADPALNFARGFFVVNVSAGAADADGSNNGFDRSVTFDARADVSITLAQIGGYGYVPPGFPGGWTVDVNRSPLNPPGPVQVTIDIDALPGEVSFTPTAGSVACDAGTTTGTRRSRFNCTVSDNGSMDLATFDVRFSTGPDEAYRRVAIDVNVSAGGEDAYPFDNRAVGQVEVRGTADLVALESGTYPYDDSAINITEESTLRFGVYDVWDGLVKQPRAEIELTLPPSAIRGVTSYVIGEGPDDWTCAAPQATATGSLIACQGGPSFAGAGAVLPTTYFLVRFMAPERAADFDYRIETRITVTSDIVDNSPDDNSATATHFVDQSTNMTIAASRASEYVMEPQVATFSLYFGNQSVNLPVNPRVNIAFDKVIPPGDIAVTDALGVPVACVPGTATSGSTAVNCPFTLENPKLLAHVTTNPSMPTDFLGLRATVSSDRWDQGTGGKYASAYIRIIGSHDMCLGMACGSLSPTPYPAKLSPNAVNTLVFDVTNQGPSTSKAQILAINVALPRTRLSGWSEEQACFAPTDLGGGVSQVRCRLPDMPGNGRKREVMLNVNTVGLTSGNVAVDLSVGGGGTERDPPDNVLNLMLPITSAPRVDLWTTVVAKETQDPAPAQFLVTAGAGGDATADLSRLVVEVDMDHPSGAVVVGGTGWQCMTLAGIPSDPRRVQCDRVSPLAPGSNSQLVVTVPADRFEQIGRGIRVSASHQFAGGAAVQDSYPSNNNASATWVVGGRRTQSSKGPAAGAGRSLRPDPGTANAGAPDLCLSFQGSHCEIPVDYPVLIAEGGRARLPFAVVNRGTGTAVNARVVFDLSLPRGLFEFDDGNELCPEPVMLGTIVRFTCFIGDLPADGSVRTLWMSVDATTLTTSDRVGLVAVARTDSVDPVTSNNQRNLQIPVYPAADLRLTLQPKGEGRYPSPQHFLIEAGIAGTSAQRHLVEVAYDVELLRTPPRVTSEHWNCSNATYTLSSGKLICRPRWGLPPDEMTQIAIAFQPAFLQIGRPITVRARHVFEFGASAGDPTAEDARSQTAVVIGGRETQGVKKASSTSPSPAGAGGPRRAVHAPRPGRASAQR